MSNVPEFKRIRKKWKAKKKEEEAARKADDERARQGQGDPRATGDNGENNPYGMRTPLGAPANHQLPPIGYAPAGTQPPAQCGSQSPALDGMAQYGDGSSFPQSPYRQNNPMYQQRQ